MGGARIPSSWFKKTSGRRMRHRGGRKWGKDGWGETVLGGVSVVGVVVDGDLFVLEELMVCSKCRW